jgi:hypothetical protein
MSVYLYSCLRYPACTCKGHAPYYIVIRGLSGSIMFFTLPHKWHDFLEKKLNIKCVF